MPFKIFLKYGHEAILYQLIGSKTKIFINLVKNYRLKIIHCFCFLFLFICSCKQKVKREKEQNLSYEKAFAFREEGKADSAFLYFNIAKDVFLKRNDNKKAGYCLINMGMISTDRGDYYGAQEISLKALDYFDFKDQETHVYLRSNYNNLGIATQNLRDYKSALDFYDKATEFSKDSLATHVILNNKATTYLLMKSYDAALQIYEKILQESSKNGVEYARTLSNLSYAKWLRNPKYNVLPQYLKALRIRKEENDLWGQNSSYSYISDYYSKKQPDSVLKYASKMLHIANQLNSAGDQMDALQMLIKFGPGSEIKQYFDKYKQLDDSVQAARQNARNQFALIRYETEKHKSDFLKAQAEIVQKKNNITIQSFVVIVLMLSLISGYLWYRKRKTALQQEKELEVKNTELKYVKKIHDRVANRVYHVMSEVENTDRVDRDDLLDKLEALYDVSRDISYEPQEADIGEGFSQKLSAMLKSYSSNVIEVLIVGNEEELWDKISPSASAELFYILQEAMTNMRKHSRADTVVIKFQDDNRFLNILYSDNGVGLNGAAKGNGLKNTENRIKSINGTITFENIVEEGLEIRLTCPFA